MFKKIKYNSKVILTFALISFISLILGYLTKGSFTYTFFSVYRFNPSNLLGYVRLFTHVLGHANLQHFTSNMLIFLLIGPILEEKYGSQNLLIVILVTALTTGIIHIILSNSMLLGASGVVFAFIMLASITSVNHSEIPLTMIIVFLLYIGQEVVDVVSVSDGISHLSHIIGGLVGMGVGLYLRKHPKI